MIKIMSARIFLTLNPSISSVPAERGCSRQRNKTQAASKKKTPLELSGNPRRKLSVESDKAARWQYIVRFRYVITA